MIFCPCIRFSSLLDVIDHMRADSLTHRQDKEFFSKGWGACGDQPFLSCRHLLPELAAYGIVDGGLLAPSDFRAFLKATSGKDQRGRKRKGTVAQKIIVSPSDRVQGFLSAIEDQRLRLDLCEKVHWHCLGAICSKFDSEFISAPPQARLSNPRALLLSAPHWDTTRFHSELLFAIYGPDGRRRIRGLRSDGALISALASRHAAGFEEPDFRIKPENLRWNSLLAMTLERELLELCRAFYRTHGLDVARAEKRTEWLQREGRSAVGKMRAAQRNSPALRYESPRQQLEESTSLESAIQESLKTNKGAEETFASTAVTEEISAGKRESASAAPSTVPEVPGTTSPRSSEIADKPKPKLNFHLILDDLYRVARGESKDSLHCPTYWEEADSGLDLCAMILAQLEADASEDSREILGKRRVMRELQVQRKEVEKRANQDREMSH